MSGRADIPTPPVPPATQEIVLPPVTITAPPIYEPTKLSGGGKFWDRRWRLTITNEKQGKADAKQLDLSKLRIVFQVNNRLNQTPKDMNVIVYNVDKNTINEVLKEYTTIKLEAGYRDMMGTIFSGALTYFESGRAGPTETILKLHGNESDKGLNGSLINTTLEKGHNAYDIVERCVKDMGLKKGFITADLDQSKSPRGRALVGNPRDILRDLAEANRATFSVDNDLVNIVGYRDVLPDTTIVLNSRHGMIETPRQTMGGSVEVISLLNSRLRPGVYVRIAEGDIYSLTQAAKAPDGLGQQHQVAVDKQLQMWGKDAIKRDGFYKVIGVVHEGDTRGRPWFSRVTTATINVAATKPVVR